MYVRKNENRKNRASNVSELWIDELSSEVI